MKFINDFLRKKLIEKKMHFLSIETVTIELQRPSIETETVELQLCPELQKLYLKEITPSIVFFVSIA